MPITDVTSELLTSKLSSRQRKFLVDNVRIESITSAESDFLIIGVPCGNWDEDHMHERTPKLATIKDKSVDTFEQNNRFLLVSFRNFKRVFFVDS